MGITATDIAKAVGGDRGWMRVRDEKVAAPPVDDGQPFALTPWGDNAMQLGHILEPSARAAFERHCGIKVYPACVQSVPSPHRRASLDGLSTCGLHAIEAKCGGNMVRQWQDKRCIAPVIRRQMQFQLEVLGLDSITLVLLHRLPTDPLELADVRKSLSYCNIPEPDWQGGPFFVTIHRDTVVTKHLAAQADRLWDEVRRIRRPAIPSLFDV